ncbi:glycosyltransferase family 1 protein [bacterium]|nr:glycosyltransferase family 1 protein [bacterium]NBX98657.1 glycosyltransferase family 1 protein [bacterium]NDC94094.1 glycosyltransferase family 1 protein [bacterium]NDD83540.1 glycosyltransferase family 1 protein [bacterium]NDG29341.1 glycosyltransferase family 1 protein [bacterium]
MKIGIVCPYNLSLPGGVQQHVFEQAQELKKRGHTVKIITPKPRTALVFDDKDILFLGRSRRIKTPQRTSVDVSVSVDADAIDELLAKHKFDVIHIHEPLVPILARQMLPRITVPIIGTFHAAIPETVVARSIAGGIAPFVKSVVKHLHAVTAVSSAATSYVGKYVDTDNVVIVPNGVDLQTYKKPTHDIKRSNILYVGRLEKRKGVEYLLQAFAVFHKKFPDGRLQIAGDGPDRIKLENLAVELGISEAVDFLGYISEQQKVALLHSCRVYASPALYGESFGIVLIEAMATGAVAIGGNNSGYATVLTDIGAVGLVNPLDVDIFASRLELMMYNEPLRAQWSKWAAKSVKQYSYKKIVDSYEKIYKSLVS